MDFKKCKVIEPFVCVINDFFGNCISLSLNRGRKFDYFFSDDKLILSSKGMRLTIPREEFCKFEKIA